MAAAARAVGVLEYSAIADERILELAFAAEAAPSTLVASMDSFDDFRSQLPGDPRLERALRRTVARRRREDPRIRSRHGDALAPSVSRREDSEELKARRLRRQ